MLESNFSSRTQSNIFLQGNCIGDSNLFEDTSMILNPAKNNNKHRRTSNFDFNKICSDNDIKRSNELDEIEQVKN